MSSMSGRRTWLPHLDRADTLIEQAARAVDPTRLATSFERLREAMELVRSPGAGSEQLTIAIGRALRCALELQAAPAHHVLNACRALLDAQRARDEVEAQRRRAPLAAFPPERCGALAAKLACRPRDARQILLENDLERERYAALERCYEEIIRQEGERGERTTLLAFDRGFLEQLETERGPITPQDFARLKVAGERGTDDAALEALAIPREALVRLERDCVRRMVADAGFRSQLRDALAALRGAPGASMG